MQKLTYINTEGRSVTFGMGPPFIQAHIDGTGELEALQQLIQAPGIEGALDFGATLEPRELTVEGTLFTTDSRCEMYRLKERELSRVMNPLLDGVLVYENDRGAWRTRARPRKLPVYGTRKKDFIPFIAYFVCPSPFWEDHNETVVRLGHGVGGLRFPFTLPMCFSTVFPERVVVNDGHVETPLEITFTGPAVNPRVINETTGTHITVERTVDAGSTLYINTDRRNTVVTIIGPDGNAENATHWLSFDSSYIRLPVGENLLRYGTDNEGAMNRLTVTFRRRYIGV